MSGSEGFVSAFGQLRFEEEDEEEGEELTIAPWKVARGSISVIEGRLKPSGSLSFAVGMTVKGGMTGWAWAAAVVLAARSVALKSPVDCFSVRNINIACVVVRRREAKGEEEIWATISVPPSRPRLAGFCQCDSLTFTELALFLASCRHSLLGIAPSHHPEQHR